ncbi:hypothetical protein I314_00368 [Cryptococcus bacillisporus CA1873]|uniref:Uncharacterized protein n=1 Tax=Cryptococcus bacillisporus CA1873 TaxID=1296111 RepID=A0ABR5BJP0_CRYGA|nr:hypothetical protein I314_00368 [Cryptococcus bacillisporus CA1873]|eukprot:KIR69262.1 hypothetical protein I314_00368 [Cryptococcus gattii CA1873]
MPSQVPASPTAPGPPLRSAPTKSTSLLPSGPINDNPYNVDLVVPYSIALSKKDLKNRSQAEVEIKEGYVYLLRELEGSGFRLASKAGTGNKGQEEVWIFVGASEERVEQLLKEERRLDASHNLLTVPSSFPPAPATRLRLIYNMLTAPKLQGGLGITPGRGKWSRVKSISALHDEAADKAWVEKWTTGGDWQVGLTKGLDEDTRKRGGLGDQQPPPIHLYFEFLTTYTLSLFPITVVSVLFYFFTPPDSYPPLYALCLSLYSTIFIAIWRIKQRKFAVKWGTYGCENVAFGRLRPEYVASLGLDKTTAQQGVETVDAVQAGNELRRDTKVAASVPIIAACGVGLGVVLMGLFVLEAFVSQLYDGPGKKIVPLIPTGLFVLIVPSIVGAYQCLARLMVRWEDHPTPVGEKKSLTAKTFAMNAIVAYLGLFLSAYIYIPFGSFIMTHVQTHLMGRLPVPVSRSANSTSPATSATSSAAASISVEKHAINGGRLKSQLFTYTVTNQVSGAFLELGMPFIMRFIRDWRAGKTTIKEALKKTNGHGDSETVPTTEEEIEKRFLNKVERELALPEYDTFTDYAEMVTQFGYVVIWSLVWPLAPVFALINNYIELRSDALKICKHVRRPVGDRVETIGSWLETLSIISWIGAITNATLIYLFRPSPASPDLHSQSPNPNFPTPGSPSLSHIVSAYHSSSSLSEWYPQLATLGLWALGASHGYIVLKWVVEGIVERVWWRGSEEEREVQRMRAGSGSPSTSRLGDSPSKSISAQNPEPEFRHGGETDQNDGLDKMLGKEPVSAFWNGGEDGAKEIARIIKVE